jgi:hypothetical protein
MNKFNGLSTLFKTITAIISTVLIIAGAVLAFESRYATADDVKEFKIQTVETLQQLRKEWKDDSSKIKLQFEYDYAVRRMYDLKDQLRKAPNDSELKADYEEAKEYVKEIQKKMEAQ